MSIKSVIYLTYILRKAKEKRAELAVFDFAYAYGSIPHKLVDLADIGGHHIPLTIRAMLKEYYDKLKMKFTTGYFTIAWQRLEM